MVRVCVIGAGPSGMSFIREVQRLQEEDPAVKLDIVCYDKQSTWGGLWNFSWRAGVDQYGEQVHSTMYHHLWVNAPKEAFEYFDYTYVEHFGRVLPSFIPRAVMRDYLAGFWAVKKLGEAADIRFEHSVKSVRYDRTSDQFKVMVRDLKNDHIQDEEMFDYVLNCTGHFSTPNMPGIKGIDTFPNTVLHSGMVKSFDLFKNKRLLVIGAGYSGDDMAIQAIKFGATSAIVSYRNHKMTMKLPETITQRPEVEQIQGSKITFKDGSTVEVDVIVLATGYLHHYPYMEDSLRLTGANLYFQPQFYHNTVWLEGGNNKLLYMGQMNQFLSFTLFRIQGRWSAMYVAGKIKMPAKEDVIKHNKMLQEMEENIKTHYDELKAQSDWSETMAAECNYGADVSMLDILAQWDISRDHDGLEGYKDIQYVSKYTGNLAPKLYRPHMEIFDDSMENFLMHH